MLFALAVLVISRVDAFVILSPFRVPTSKSATIQEEGLHGSDFCFMPLEQLDNEVRWPRVLRVAGAYPGVTAAEILGTPSTIEAAPPGMWNYEFPDAHSSEFGMIAVPGSDLVQYAKDPVVVVAESSALGISLATPTEVLAVIDRKTIAFSDRHFFAFSDPSGNIVIRRFDASSPPTGYDIVGKVVVIHLPFDKKTTASSGTWLEEGDVSM